MKKIISIIILITFISFKDCNAENLLDIKGHWAEQSINQLFSIKIISGYSDNKFLPDKNITREEAATLLSKALNNGKNTYKPKSDIFKDVKNTYSAAYIDDLYNRGIINGYQDISFRPKENISREEYAAMIYRIARNEGRLILNKKITPKDIMIVSDWAKDAIKILRGNGMISGFKDGTFRPQNLITRAEAAKLLHYSLYKSDIQINPNEENNIGGDIYTLNATYLRVNPDETSEIIGKNGILTLGTEVLIEGEQGEYYLIKPKYISEAFRGYANKNNFSKQKPEFISLNNEEIKELKEDSILLKNPVINLDPTSKNSVLSKGATVQIKGIMGNYYLVKPYYIPNSEEGYILKTIID